ncbi:MAG: DUF418 domain-containing protein [Sphingomonadaceae bacterium]
MTTSPARIATLDAVRGLAVMGILVLNIVDMAMPGYAYIDPNYYGGATGANWWTWAVNYVLFDGKMRGLFTMMFGASTVLIADLALAAGESPARVHYARMVTLFILGMIHAYFIWSGDILVLYALCGMVAFAVWRWQSRALLMLAGGLLLAKLAIGLVSYGYLANLEARAQAPGASAEVRTEWRDFRDTAAPPPETVREELAAHRGSWLDAHRARVSFTIIMQTVITPQSIPDTFALIALGMALFRAGFFSGAWAPQNYWRIVAAAFLIVPPLYVPLVRWIDATAFSPVTLLATEAIHLTLLRPVMALGWASLVILFMKSGAAQALAARLVAVGRTAFSNYLGASIVGTTIFYGFGFGWYGYLERWQLLPVVVGMWILMLLWSKPWLDRFHYGPFEWLWRSMARMQWQKLRRYCD